jgi:transketolase
MKNLKDISNKVRKNIILMSLRAKSAHMGGSLSCVEILVALYFSAMNVFPKDPHNPRRDRLVFSKAHDVKALYVALALRGFFPVSLLESYEKDNAVLTGHSVRGSVPGIEVSAGSLGHGLSIACGMAYAGKIDKKNHRVFAVLSDGECQEGSTWEGFLFGGHHKLENLVVVIDYNKLQGFGRIDEVLGLEPFVEKLKNFGWEVKEVDGHDVDAVEKILQNVPFKKDKPSVLIAHTIKGFGGVPKYEDKVISHYKPPTEEEAKDAIKKLEEK